MDAKVNNKTASLPRQATSRADNNRWIKFVYPIFFYFQFHFSYFLLNIPRIWLLRFRQGQEQNAKRLKTDPKKAQLQEKNTKEVGVKMIELDFPSSDEEL